MYVRCRGAVRRQCLVSPSGVVGAAPEQQSAVGGHSVVIKHKATVVDCQIFRVDLSGQVSQRRGGHDAAHRREDLALELFGFQRVVDITGQHHLFGIDRPCAVMYGRAVAMNDLQDFGVLEDQHTQAFCRACLADAQVERVQVHVAGVLHRSQVLVAGQVGAHSGCGLAG